MAMSEPTAMEKLDFVSDEVRAEFEASLDRYIESFKAGVTRAVREQKQADRDADRRDE